MATPDRLQSAGLDLQPEIERLRLIEERLRLENEHLLETQRSLEDAREYYADLSDSSPSAWLSLDERGCVRDANRAALALINLPQSQLTGVALTVLAVAEHRGRVLAHLEASGSCTSACEVTLQKRDGVPVPVRLTTRRAGSPSLGYTSWVIDLREPRALLAEHERLASIERELRAANAAKDQFIAMLSHELRTPLTPVLAVASAFVDLPELAPELRSAFAIVQRNVKIEAQLIDDLLDAARIAHGKMHVEKQPMDIHVAIHEALETLLEDVERKRLTLTVELSAERSYAQADSTRMKQVFWNLLRNAIKFTPEDGGIAFRTWNNDGKLLIEVSDTGRGIADSELNAVFEPFKQAPDDAPTSLRGLGLGLPICKGLLEQHGARIFAASPGLGKGSRFVIELTTIDEAPVHRSRLSSAPPPPGPKPRLLLVEDHEDTAEVMRLLLVRDGFEVQVAESVHSALVCDDVVRRSRQRSGARRRYRARPNSRAEGAGAGAWDRAERLWKCGRRACQQQGSRLLCACH